MTGVGAPAGRCNPMLTVVRGEGSGYEAQVRWRAVNAPHLVALVRAGATFINGRLIERPGEAAA